MLKVMKIKNQYEIMRFKGFAVSSVGLKPLVVDFKLS